MKDKDDEAEKVSLESQEPIGCHLNGCDKETLPSKPVSEKPKIKEEKSLEYKDMGETKAYITGPFISQKSCELQCHLSKG